MSRTNSHCEHPGYSAYYNFYNVASGLSDEEVWLAYSYGNQHDPGSWNGREGCRRCLEKEIELRKHKPEFKAAYAILKLEGLL